MTVELIPQNKCELHVHLEGCVWPYHIENWWSKSSYLFPPPALMNQNKKNFDTFLSHLRFCYNFLNNISAYVEVATLYANRCIKDSITYSEIQINLALLNTWGINLNDLLDAIGNRLSSISNAPTVRYIVDLPWQFDAMLLQPIISNLDELWSLGVRGISMGGDESLARPNDVQGIFDDARDAGLEVLCHAGETTQTSKAIEIVEALKPKRIAHGLSLADWIAERGVKSPAIDICLSSNLALGLINSVNDHPLKKWWEAGVPLSLSTDDPAVFQTSLNEEYKLAFSICPEIAQEYETVKKHWLRAALDVKALEESLNTI